MSDGPGVPDGSAGDAGGGPAAADDRWSTRAGLLPLMSLALVLVAGLTSPWWPALWAPAAHVESDFQILFAAGQGQAAGEDVHDPAVLDAWGRRSGRAATPFCAANPLVVGLFGLFDGEDLSAAYRSWLGVGWAAAAVAVLALAAAGRRLGVSAPVAAAVALAVVALPTAFWHSQAMNSTNLVTLAALACALAAGLSGRSVLEGLALAVASVAKTSPALVLVAALLAGRRRTALAGALGLLVAGAASLVVNGWEVHTSWATRVLPRLGYAPPVEAGRFDNSLHAWNLAPHGWLARTGVDVGWPPTLVAVAALAVALLVLWQLVAALRAARAAAGGRAADPRVAGAVHALGVSAALLVSSVTWPHHLVWMAIPVGWMAWRTLVDGVRPARVAGLVAGLAVVLPLGSFDAGPLQTADVALRTAACLLLFGACTADAAAAPQGTAPFRGEPS